ncbi:hypothetical protein LZ30DRAFT_537771, partial [Colletotrichum cereale]
GRIPDQALSRGCVHDFVSGAWVHRKCYEEELEQEFLAARPWRWWADENRTREVTVEEIRTTGGPSPIYVTPGPDYHDIHCAYTWKKMHRAILGGRKLDGHIGSVHHTEHC